MGAQRQPRAPEHRDIGVVHRRGAVDRVAASIAARQQGNVTYAQLLGVGLQRGAISRRVERGWLRPMHRGVYFVGHGEITAKARAMAAVLACGEGAVVSHRSAAYLHGLLPYPAQYRDVEVTVPGRTIDARPGIVVRRTIGFDRRDIRTLDDIPITSPARTLLDVAASTNELDAAFDEAVFRRRVRHPQLRELIQRSAGRPGVKALRALVEAESAGERNRLEAEKRFRALMRAAKLPRPKPNGKIGHFVVDFFWPEHRVVAELDGFATHGKRSAFEGDRARDGDLSALDYRVIRVTWRQLTREPYSVVARIAAMLALSSRELAFR